MSIFKRLAAERSGNFGMMTAIMLPVLIGAAGIAIDFGTAMDQKNRLRGLADASTLAAASAMADSETGMTNAEAEAMAKSYFIGQALQAAEMAGASKEELAKKKAELAASITVKAITTTKSKTAESYEVRMNANVNIAVNGMTSLLGMKTVNVAVDSYAQSGREGNALSMYLVLDESGSMAYDTTTVNPSQPTKQVQKKKTEIYSCPTRWNPGRTCEREVTYYDTETNYISKMASLKAAAATMFDELKKADPSEELIRVGADSYTDKTMSPEAISWGTAKVASYVKKLPDEPAGGTDASGAMTNAFNALKASNATEKNAQKSKDNTAFSRFIVLMTDGEMTGNSNKWNEAIDKQVRKICTDAKADKDANGKGIKIYTIAFMAPANGKSLLNECASGDDYYYEPNDMSSLVQTFADIARKAAATGTRLTN